jgi:nicotinate-nucleotide--dimethylbenzimidazole phosphoribosyltransferase
MPENTSWSVLPVNNALDSQVLACLNGKTKPPGSLGKIEQLAFQIARIQQTLKPEFQDPVVLIFAGDHGIARSGLVNPFPQEVTYQMVMNFLNGGAAINAMAGVAGMNVKVVDAGVNYQFPLTLPLVHAKTGMGTANYQSGQAMDNKTCEQAMLKGDEVVTDVIARGTNVMGFGEMGIGNTSSASLIVSTVCDIPLAECVGMGTGATDEFLVQKLETLQQVQSLHNLNARESTTRILATYGGFEIAQMVGGMLKAASSNCLIMVDGFISTAAFLLAQRIAPAVKDYAVFTHKSEERGHQKVLQYLNAEPLLQLAMRLGEGTGCAAGFPLIKMAVEILNKMASFDSAAVSSKTNS